MTAGGRGGSVEYRARERYCLEQQLFMKGASFFFHRSADANEAVKSTLLRLSHLVARVLRSVSRMLSRMCPEPRCIFLTFLQARGRKDLAGILCLQGTRILQGVQRLIPCTCARLRGGSARPLLVFLGANKRLAACAAAARMRWPIPCVSAASFSLSQFVSARAGILRIEQPAL